VAVVCLVLVLVLLALLVLVVIFPLHLFFATMLKNQLNLDQLDF